MDPIWDSLLELQTYWKAISFIGVLILVERIARRRVPIYGPWARKENNGRVVILTTVLIAVLVLGFLAFHGERRKNVASVAIVVGQPGIVYNVNGINAITAYLRIENYGQTVANDGRWEVGVNVLDLEARDGPFAGLGEPQLREGPIAIAPGEPIVRHPKTQWPSDAGERAEMVASVKARDKGIFVFGRITYKTLDEAWSSGFCRIYAGHNTYVYDNQTASIPLEAYPDQEFVPCPNAELNYSPRKTSKP